MDKDYRALLDALDPLDLAMVDIPAIGLFSHYLTVMEDFLEAESQECSNDDHLYSMVLGGFGDILRASFFVNLYASFESYLVGMCVDCEFPRKTNKVKKAVHFLIKDKSVRSSLYKRPEWKEIDDYRVLRNCIVHDEGELTPHTRERDKLEKYVSSKYPLLRLSYDNIFLSRDFCKEAIGVIDRFSIAVLIESGRLAGISGGQLK